MTKGWPATLVDGPVGLRPLRLRDAFAWAEVRRTNVSWLTPWEATQPGQPMPAPTVTAYLSMLLRLRRQAAAGVVLPFAMTYGGRLVGQLTVGGITHGASPSAYVGYWIDHRFAGRGITPTAVALAADHCFGVLRLRRIEANVRPENSASRRVVDKLGFRETELRRRFLYIDGAWRDHLCFVVTPQDVPDGMLARWHAGRP